MGFLKSGLVKETLERSMTLKEAIDSGLEYKHVSQHSWYDRFYPAPMNVHMAVSNEWEVRTPQSRVTFSNSDIARVIWAAWNYDMKNASFSEFEKEMVRVANAVDNNPVNSRQKSQLKCICCEDGNPHPRDVSIGCPIHDVRSAKP